MTYSIVARDPVTGEFGVAAQSHWFGVGRVLGWAEPGVGVVATQGFHEVSYGPLGIESMRKGANASRTLVKLLDADSQREFRQVSMIDATGEIAVHTGSCCVEAAGHIAGSDLAAQGNMLVSDGCWLAMLEAYSRGSGSMALRLLAALDAAEATGGDSRGRQSACILVVAGPRTDAPWEAPRIDCRVDDHPDPLLELRRLVTLQGFYDRLSELFGVPGILNGAPTASEQEVESVVKDLRAGEIVLGKNVEATMWIGVIFARYHREHEARDCLALAIESRPQLAGYLRSMVRTGIFPDPAVLDRVLPSGP